MNMSRIAHRTRLGAILTLAALVLATGSAPAGAALSTTPDPTLQTDGTVHAIVRAAGVVYIAGEFTHIRPSGAAPGTNLTARSYVAAFNADTGQLLTNWNPGTNGVVRALAVSANGRSIIIGGDFTTAGGARHKHLASVTTCVDPAGATCSSPAAVRPSFTGGTDGSVYALATDGGRVYVGGLFSRVNGAVHHNLVALNGHGKSLRFAGANDLVHALAVSANGSRLFVGGNFTKVGGNAQRYMAVVTAGAGVPLPWHFHPKAFTKGITVSPGSVVVVGSGLGGFVDALNPASGRKQWESWADGDIDEAAVYGSQVFITGHFRHIGSKQWPRVHLAALSGRTGKINQNWVANQNGVLGGFTVTVAGAQLYAGGNFTKIAGIKQEGLAQFSD